VQGFGANTEGKRPLGSLRSRWEDDIIMDFKEKYWESMDCIYVA
jgi:hypothetical protein